MEWPDSGTYLLQAIGAGLGSSNDNFADARAISGASGSRFGNTEEATVEVGEPNLHPSYNWGLGDLFGSSVWYAWTAPEGIGPTSFLLRASEDPLGLGVYTGSLGSLTEVAYNVRSPAENEWGRAQVAFTPTAGTTYYIGVGSYWTVGFTLSWAPSAPPANDNFADALPLPADTTGSTIEATHEAGEPVFRGGNADLGGRSVWYTYTAAEPTAVDISLEGSSYFPRLGVYTGSLGSLSEVGYSDSDSTHPAEVSFVAEAGTIYHIGIGGGGANDYIVDGGQTVRWGGSGTYVLHMTSSPASAPVVTLDPQSQTVNAGQTASFTAAATGAPIPSVQWQVSTDGGSTWNNIVGETSATLSFTTSNGHHGYQYRAVFTNGVGSDTSNAATLTVHWAPVVTIDPVSQTVLVGETATFTAAADGNPAPDVQWYSSSDGGATWMGIMGETSTTLTMTALAGMDGWLFRARFTNVAGEDYSNPATLTVSLAPTPPVVTVHPTGQTVVAGETATFTAAASGNPAPSVQWYVSSNGRKWTIIPGRTATTLTVTGYDDGYQFRAVFTNSEGSATTNAATLTVTPPTADVRIDHTSAAVYDPLGGTITWTLTVTNDGPDIAGDVGVTNVLARGMKFVSMTVDGVPYAPRLRGSRVGIDLGTMASGESATITIVSDLGRAALPVANNAEVATTSFDNHIVDNTSSQTVTG
jgi:uncharacterized repeat protein (TIGR01451 family)